MNWLQTIIDFFKPSKPYRGTGVIPNAPDVRDIQYSQVMSVKPAQKEFISDISKIPVFDQGFLGTCVAHVFVTAKMFLDFKETGKVVTYSRRFLYSLTRQFQKLIEAQGQGSSPRECAKVIVNVGADIDRGNDDNSLPHATYVSYKVTDEMKQKAKEGMAKGYAFVSNDIEEIKHAIENTGFVMATLPYDTSTWLKGLIRAIKKLFGWHYIYIYGYVGIGSDVKLLFRNSWSTLWGFKGNGEFWYSEYKDSIRDMMVLIDLPNDLLQRAKNSRYIFLNTLRFGSKGDDVKRLQEYLKALGLLIAPVDGDFGFLTMDAVKQYQRLKGLAEDGILGQNTRAILNADNMADTKPKAKLDLWCEAIAKMEGANPKLNNPGNLRFVGQKEATGQDSRGFCIFPDFATGYMVLRRMIENACIGKSKVYKPTDSILQFFQKYAPDSDGNNSTNYANFVAKYIGVPVSTPIKELLA